MAHGTPVFRIHPAIGIARVGNSEEFYLGPETPAGMPVDHSPVSGGLPIRAGTESTTITSAELRDRNGALKRQAARFRVFAYEHAEKEAYPNGGGTEIQIGTVVGGRTVADIVWTVHLANKKSNSYVLNDDLGMMLYEEPNRSRMRLRNEAEGLDPDNAARRYRLISDAGPRAIKASGGQPVRFDKSTRASFGDGAAVEEVAAYPKSFPDDGFANLYAPVGKIDTLGELRTDDQGRLLVIAAYGKACGWLRPDGTPFPLEAREFEPGVYGDVNADGWFDDTADGPVGATLVFGDGSTQDVHGAWVVCTVPSYAPQVQNVVSLWDDMFDSWVRKMDLRPDVFGHRFCKDYRPAFDADIAPIFRAVALQRWTTNLPDRAIDAHDAVGRIAADDHPDDTIMTGLAYVRDPNHLRQTLVGAPFMPLSMGDAGRAFLTVTLTQYFMLQRWNAGEFEKRAPRELGPGEFLDRAVLVNCLGGRFAPGIEMTFMVRDPNVWVQDWERSDAGPFRFRARKLDYRSAQIGQPFLTVGYVPNHPGPDGIHPAPVEPGDPTKFMAIPWHTDYSACGTHNSAPNPLNSSTLYWSWPAQRPFAVYVAQDVVDGKLGEQRYSIRGPGATSKDLGTTGRYQNLEDMVLNWHHIGIVVQGSAIAGDGTFSKDQFLEVEGQLDEPEVVPWPMNSIALGT